MPNTRTLTTVLIVLTAACVLVIAGAAILYTQHVIPTYYGQVYRDDLKVVIQHYKNDLTGVSALLQQWSDGDADSTWKPRLDYLMDSILSTGKELRALTPPEQYREAHGKLVVFSLMMDNVARNMMGEWNLFTMITVLNSLNDATIMVQDALVEIYGEDNLEYHNED